MSIELQPKARFQENEEILRVWRAIVDNKVFADAVLHAMAEYSVTLAPSAEELNGARLFLHVLLNLGETEKPLPQMPSKRLSLTPDTRAKSLGQQRSPQPQPPHHTE